jgi:hypothetical protein
MSPRLTLGFHRALSCQSGEHCQRRQTVDCANDTERGTQLTTVTGMTGMTCVTGMTDMAGGTIELDAFKC